MNDVFISYRKSDNADQASRIYNTVVIALRFGAVCESADTIPIGVDLREHLSNAVGQAKAAVVVIGPDWLGVADADGRRRIDVAIAGAPEDRFPNAQAMAAALEREGGPPPRTGLKRALGLAAVATAIALVLLAWAMSR